MNIYAPWEDLEKELPELDFANKNWEKEENEWLDKLITRVREESDHELAGEIVTFPVGDGYARYVIFDKKDLIHIPLGDAWHDPNIAHISFEGVKARLEQMKALKALFS